MSTPKNPLDYFRTYSYHHILVACDGTDSAESLASSSEITMFDHEGYGEGKYMPRSAPNGMGSYVVLINGMSDARLSVKSAKWTSTLVPRDEGVQIKTAPTMTVSGDMTILEPNGINFLNIMNDTTKRLGVDASSVVFLLKTVFTGHKYNGAYDVIMNIQPLLITVYNITAMFDTAGAEYNLEFCGTVNGVAQLPQASIICDSFAFALDKDQTLGNIIEVSLPAAIKELYARKKNTLVESYQRNNSKIDFNSEFTDVEYTFKLHNAYKNYIVDIIPVQAQSTGFGDGISGISGDSTNIESILDMIMQSSKAVLNDYDKDGNRYMYKITSSAQTSRDKYVIEYQIHRYKTATIKVEDFLNFEPPAGTGIEFDYIFTGKNVDVKSFDIKMQFGLAFFQTLNATSSMPTTGSSKVKTKSQPVAGTGNKDGAGDQSSTKESTNEFRKKPLFLGLNVKDPAIRNTREPEMKLNYNALLARHAAYESLEARLVIRGNPQLLSDTSQLPDYVRDPNLDPDDTSGTNSPSVIAIDNDDAARNYYKSIHNTPSYVKVNVFMPVSFSTNDGTSAYGSDYAKNFWYPGWYTILQISNTFSDGDFTQELELISMPVDFGQQDLNRTESLASGVPQSQNSNIPATGTAGTTSTEKQTAGDKVAGR